MRDFEPGKEGFLGKLWRALGRLLSFYPCPSVNRETEQSLEKSRQFFATRDDGEALAPDWQRVGEDIRKAMERYHRG